MWRNLLITAALATSVSCHTSRTWTPRYHGVLSTTSWETLTPRPRSTSSAEVTESRAVSACDFRAQIVERALALHEKGASGGDFGQADVERILEQNEVRTGWTARRGIDALADLAARRGALASDADIAPGDIVFFHNVADHNGNGQNDDWLGAVGIAVARDGDVVEAVVRTGNAPRKIVLFPGGPGVRALDKRVVNSYLRVPSRDDPPQTDYLAGRLYAGHIDIDRFAGSRRCTEK